MNTTLSTAFSKILISHWNSDIISVARWHYSDITPVSLLHELPVTPLSVKQPVRANNSENDNVPSCWSFDDQWIPPQRATDT